MVLLVPVLAFLCFLVFCALMTVGQPLNPTRPLMSYDQAREYAHRLQRLIACKSVSREESYDDIEFAKLREVMEELFPLVHQYSRKLTFGDDCWVYMVAGKDAEKNIMLMAHHDVVPAEGQWQHDPFTGVIAEGKLWGRGTVDNKTSLFAIFSAVEELLSEGFTPSCNVWIASSHNKEVAGDGMPLAAAYFREQGITFDFILDQGGAVVDAPLPGMTCSKCAMVAIHEKGRHKLVLTAEEISHHAGIRSTPTERMAEFIAAFRKEDIFIRRVTPELEAMLKAMAPHMTFSARLVFANLWFFKPMLKRYLPRFGPQAADLLGTTCAFNDLITEEGGKKCTARIMLRCMDGEDLQKDLTRLRTLATKYGIRVEDGGDSEYHGPTDTKQLPYAQITRYIRDIFPDVPVIPFVLPDGTDARSLSELSNCVLRFSPLRLSAQQLASIHGADENVDIGAIGTAVVFYRRVLERYGSGEVREDLDEDEEFEDELPVEEDITQEEVPEESMEMDIEIIGEDPLDVFSEDSLYDIPEELLEALSDELVEEDGEDFLDDTPDYSMEELSLEELKELSNWEEIL